MIHHKIEGMIIKLSPFKEFDKVIVFFSPALGVLRVVGKGVRRPRSQRSYHLDLFNIVDADLESAGRTGSLWYLREINTKEHQQYIKKDPVRFSCASIIALFVARMIPEGAPHQQDLYALTLQAFTALNTPAADEATTQPAHRIVFTFLLKAVKLLGYLEDTLKNDMLESELLTQLDELDPQFTLQARRTLSIFSTR